VKLEPESSTKKGSKEEENGGAWYSVLITQCIQNDLLRPLSLDESLPNRAHVGRSESERLLGRGCSREAPGINPPSLHLCVRVRVCVCVRVSCSHVCCAHATQRTAWPADPLGQDTKDRRADDHPHTVQFSPPLLLVLVG
jgi:hypothetical protein